MGVIQITTTIDEADHAEAQRRGIKWSRAVEAGINQLIRGQNIEDELLNLRDANNHLRYSSSVQDHSLKVALEQNELLKKKLEELGFNWADYLIKERNLDEMQKLQ